VNELRTERMLLRRWRVEDEADMARINRQPEVGRYLNRPTDEQTIAAFFSMITGHWAAHGYGPWALESTESGWEGRFLGFAGLAHLPPFLAAVSSLPELGWRLDPAVWGRGLATEAAVAARDDAFERLGLPELISIIHPENRRSQRVAAKLSMRLDRQIENPVLGRLVDVWTCQPGGPAQASERPQRDRSGDQPGG
jgi:RimJ/RimL family protein N-acetyltransferase